MPDDALRPAKAESAAFVVYLYGVDAQAIEPEAPTQRPVVSQEALGDALNPLAFLCRDRRHCGVLLKEANVASLHLRNNYHLALNRDDVGLQAPRSPVALKMR